MRCTEIRERLVRRSGDPEIAAHLGSCPACTRYAARLAAARDLLAREAGVLPDAGFARRVVARLPTSAQVLGWAALRALPAAIVLALAIGAVGVFEMPSAESSLLNDEASPEAILAYTALPADGTAPAPAVRIVGSAAPRKAP
jgi:anti-sigma factor RsiW